MYESKSDLPKTLREYLPDELQDIYLKAYQESWNAYEEQEGGQAGRDAVAHRDAMHAVEKDHVYDQETGEWHRKGEEVEAAKKETGLLGRLKKRIEDL